MFLLQKRKGIYLKKRNHHDRRVRRTQKLIRKAFLQLIAEKEYHQITVTDIIQKADYNRATFYRHYHDKDDLVTEIIDRQIDLFIDAFIYPYRYEEVIDIGNIRKDQIVLFDHILEHKDFYSLWNRLKTVPGFAPKYTNCINVIFKEKIVVTRSLEKGVDKELYTQFYAFGLAGIIFSWIGNGFQQSPDYMAEQLMMILRLKPGKSMLYPNVSSEESNWY